MTTARATPPAPPPALVLTGGGARGAYQVGVLAAIAERAGADFSFPVLTGVSAGAINAACLAGSRAPLDSAIEGIRQAWLGLTIESVFRTGFPSLTASLARWMWMVGSGGTTPGFDVKGLLDTAPLRRYLEPVIDAAGIEANIADGRLQALALSATSYGTGETITFVDGAPGIDTWERVGRRAVRDRITVDHVMASSALPLVFPAIELAGQYFGDGSIRQHAPLAPAIHLGADRLLAISVRHPRTVEEAIASRFEGYPPPAQILGMLMNSVFLDSLAIDCERMERVNELIARIPPGTAVPDELRPIDVVAIKPSRDLGQLAADLGRHLPRTFRVLMRGLGSERLASPDFLSYLLFERPYIERLIELGYDDGSAEWERIEPFLAGS